MPLYFCPPHTAPLTHHTLLSQSRPGWLLAHFVQRPARIPRPTPPLTPPGRCYFFRHIWPQCVSLSPMQGPPLPSYAPVQAGPFCMYTWSRCASPPPRPTSSWLCSFTRVPGPDVSAHFSPFWLRFTGLPARPHLLSRALTSCSATSHA